MRTRYSIRTQVTLLTFIPMLVMTLSLEVFFLYARFSDLDNGLLERGKLIARQLASSSEYGVFSNNLPFLQNTANAVLQQPDVRGVVILNSASVPMISAGKLSGSFRTAALQAGVADFSARFKRIGEVKSAINALTSTGHIQEGLWIYQPIVSEPVALSDFDVHPDVKQVGAIIVEMSDARVLKIKKRMLFYTLLATLLFFACALYLIHLAGRRITTPIRKLSEAIQTIGKGALDTRVSVSARVRELNTLEHGINDMAEQLHQERGYLQSRIDEATAALRKQKEGAERANHDKSRFLAAASHDMRQPIHALGLYLDELRRVISSEQQQHLLEKVEHSVDAISSLINALLDISKLDAGVVTPHKQVCDLSAMLKRIATDFQMLAGIKNIRLVFRPFQGYAISDPILLERVLINLVSNAVRYTQPGGVVLIACRRRGNQLRIEVRDNGIGIAKIDQVNIFREFFQLAQSHTGEQKGTGLGLAIVDRLVKLLGHRISLRSELGRGSLFALELTEFHEPAEPAAQTEVLPVPRNASTAVERVLIVDDDALVLESTSTIVASWGYQVSSAASLEAVHQMLIDGKDWDFIISDYRLDNDATGLDVVETVRQFLEKPIPCILISGDTSSDVQRLVNEAGYPLLYKPVKPAKLRSLMQFLLKGEAPA